MKFIIHPTFHKELTNILLIVVSKIYGIGDSPSCTQQAIFSVCHLHQKVLYCIYCIYLLKFQEFYNVGHFDSYFT